MSDEREIETGGGRNRPGLTLHVPEPPFRPGDAVDYSYLDVPPPDMIPRPDETAPAADLHGLAYGLVRVLDDGNQAVGSWAPRLDDAHLLRMLRTMALQRAFDDRMFRAQRQGKTSFYMKATGEEAVAIGAAFALDREDMCFPSYRQQGILFARQYPLLQMINQIYSNRLDPLFGRQLPVMYSARDYGFFTLSGNLTTQYPQAVGWAMASASKGDSRIAAVWCGEGSTSEGDFHNGLTFGAVYNAPCIFNVVNNQYAISSYSGFAGSERTTFAARAIGYGIPGLRVDGNDILAVYAATQWAANRARLNLGPTLIELFTYRAEAHSTSDDPSVYRSAQERQEWPLGDPITRLKRHCIARGIWDMERHAAMDLEVAQEVQAAQKEAEKNGILGHGLHQPDQTMFQDVYEDMPWHLREQCAQAIRERKIKWPE
ncbi:thiamine pyrophosphate-dependent enzyme [Caenibius sp. WL]|uniref:thiamine pyrophosphate-dependent enzyme n=1 Tax=Caenibius sp. WL TaxID=2872646 RepID=UPI001C99BD7A|nr:thiamine pyrophosphate-dependent enzyme [Caenibius sp. WL]QZP08480.1 3-methyl-2-oxobutanoate dehydrogenase (2-methylpropanoyl-transferring) subunit alpha [Caenibius sp. WL]